MSPAEHDRAVAAISHVPHVVASALAAATPEESLPLAAGGWFDATRIAAADVELWRQILAQNRGHVLKALAQFEKVLSGLRAALQSENDAKLLKILQAGKNIRDAVGSRHPSG
jgi:prephenate dehydrogenase